MVKQEFSTMLLEALRQNLKVTYQTHDELLSAANEAFNVTKHLISATTTTAQKELKEKYVDIHNTVLQLKRQMSRLAPFELEQLTLGILPWILEPVREISIVLENNRMDKKNIDFDYRTLVSQRSIVEIINALALFTDMKVDAVEPKNVDTVESKKNYGSKKYFEFIRKFVFLYAMAPQHYIEEWYEDGIYFCRLRAGGTDAIKARIDKDKPLLKKVCAYIVSYELKGEVSGVGIDSAYTGVGRHLRISFDNTVSAAIAAREPIMEKFAMQHSRS